MTLPKRQQSRGVTLNRLNDDSWTWKLDKEAVPLSLNVKKTSVRRTPIKLSSSLHQKQPESQKENTTMTSRNMQTTYEILLNRCMKLQKIQDCLTKQTKMSLGELLSKKDDWEYKIRKMISCKRLVATRTNLLSTVNVQTQTDPWIPQSEVGVKSTKTITNEQQEETKNDDLICIETCVDIDKLFEVDDDWNDGQLWNM